tara:strand:+ start:89 stop:607 length:519 start_codon:yes stop_codon:yes gene_type:complete
MFTLKIDSSFRPVAIIDSIDGFSMVWSGRANLVEVYDDRYLHSTHEAWPEPCVISINRFVKFSNFTLGCNRKNIFWRDANTCQYCGNIFSENKLTLDHVTPRSKGGPKTWENIVTSCVKCNQKKGNKLPHEVNMMPLRLPKPPNFDIYQVIGRKHIPPKWLPYLQGYKPFKT